MVLGAKKHTANKIGGGNARSSLHDLEATCRFDESVTIVAVTIRCNVVAVYDILATIVRNPRQVGHVRGMGNALSSPATGIDGCDTNKGALHVSVLLLNVGSRDRAHRSSNDMTVGPLFSRIAWSEWMPTTRALPRRRAWSMAPAWPIS